MASNSPRPGATGPYAALLCTFVFGTGMRQGRGGVETQLVYTLRLAGSAFNVVSVDHFMAARGGARSVPARGLAPNP
jgi:hypothetical protein